MNLTVGQKVKVCGQRHGRIAGDDDGEIIKLGRKYATVTWGPAHYQTREFEIATGYEKGDRYGNGIRLSVGVDVTYRSPLNPQNTHLSQPQIEELAAIVRQMLSEKPADYDSEVKP